MNGYYASPYGAQQSYDSHHQYNRHSSVLEQDYGAYAHGRNRYQQHYEPRHLHHQHQSVYTGPLEDRATARAHLDRLISGLATSSDVPHLYGGGVRDSFMRSSVAPSPAYEQRSQMMQLPPPMTGCYDPAFDAAIRHTQHNLYKATAAGFGRADAYTAQHHAHFADNTQEAFRDARFPSHFPSTEQVYPQQLTGLQPAFEPYATAGAWQHGFSHDGGLPAPGEDFEAGWHAGHYSSPTHLLGQELYADVPHTADGFEHPTFLRPAEIVNAHGMVEQVMPVDVPHESVDEPQLIAPDASAIPPPLPIEKSAHPLAALATDIVWEAFLAAANSNSPASSTQSHFTTANSAERSPSSGRSKVGGSPAASRYSLRSSVSPTAEMFKRSASKASLPYVASWNRSRSASIGLEGEAAASNGFGAIGRERKPRRSFESSPGSDSSSPASTAPGTPAMDAWMAAEALHTGRLGVSGHWAEDESHQQQDAKQALPPLSSLLRSTVPQRFGGVKPPFALYDQIQKLLSATLLSQQVLVLALYYVTRVPHTSPLYPPATSQSALQSTSAPFKLLLAALVVANKHLDDNSFRNSTFSQVSNITLPEVNALEYSLLAGLNFDLNIDTPAWLVWLRDLEEHHSTAFVAAQRASAPILSELIRGVEMQRDQQELANEQGRHAVSLSCDILASPGTNRRTRKPSLFDLPMTPRSDSSMSGCFDLDASGPLEQRPRYSKQIILPPVPYASSYGACGSSSYHARGVDFDYPGRMMMA